VCVWGGGGLTLYHQFHTYAVNAPRIWSACLIEEHSCMRELECPLPPETYSVKYSDCGQVHVASVFSSLYVDRS
jgi:hypothetical protein